MPYSSGTESFAKIKIVGVGSDGCNYLDWIIGQGLKGVEFIAIHSDELTLTRSAAPVHIRIGPKTTRGLGAGYNSEIGLKAAEESVEELYNALKAADMVFVIAGMSGGTGTGAAPIVAQIAAENGALTVGVVTTPYEVEGTRRLQAAAKGVRYLQEHTDALFVFSKQRMLGLGDKRLNLKELSKRTEMYVYKTVQGIVELITIPGLINIDFSDIRYILERRGEAVVGLGEASGDDRGWIAAEMAISTSTLNDSISQAKHILLNFTGGPSFTLFEVNQAAEIIRSRIHPDIDIIFGAIVDPEIGDRVCVTIYAMGLDQEKTETNAGLLPEILEIGETNMPKEKAELINPERLLRVFLCHSSGDKPVVRSLYQKLRRKNGFAPWLDEVDLLPGEQWDLEIKKAVKKSDVVIVCLSRNVINKEGYIQKEIKFALDVADEKPEGTIFIIPLKLEECDVPERLRNWQWVNYYEEGAFDRLLKSLQKRAGTIGIQLS